MAMVVDIVVEVGLVMNIRAIEQSRGLNWAYFSQQIVQEEESFLVIILAKDESRWKEVQVFDICLIVSDSTYIRDLYLVL